MSKNDTTSIGDIYGKMLNSLRYNIQEKAKTFEGKVELVGDGPNVSGYNEIDAEYTGKKGTRTKTGKKFKITKSVHNAEEDEQSKVESTEDKIKAKLKAPNLSQEKEKSLKAELKRLQDSEERSESEERIQESKKNTRQTLNRFMSKSVFDKLYSKVLRENFGEEDKGEDLGALGLDDSTPDSEMGYDFGGEDDMGDEDGEVTFTLDRETAQKLIDVLQTAIGGEAEDEGDDLDFEDEGEDEHHFGEEDEEQGTEVAPTGKGKQLQGKSNKVQGFPSAKSGKAKADVTDETGTKDGAPSITALQGKNNQVPGSTLKKAATDYFR